MKLFITQIKQIKAEIVYPCILCMYMYVCLRLENKYACTLLPWKWREGF